MLNRLHWQISRQILRHILVAIVGATALVAAAPARAELTVEAAGRLPSEAAAETQANPVTPDQTTPDPLGPSQVTADQLAPEQAVLSPTAPPTEAAETETNGTAKTTGAAPLDLEPLDLSAPPPAPVPPEELPIDAESRVANRRLVIRLDQRRVFVYEGEATLVSYPIAVGRQGWETPKGEFEVFQMIEDPSWQHPWNGSIVPPGPDNPLGRRWIGFWTDGVNAIGFHGTPNESLVGQAVSHGCIRMKNADVQNLFAMVANGTTVTVE